MRETVTGRCLAIVAVVLAAVVIGTADAAVVTSGVFSGGNMYPPQDMQDTISHCLSVDASGNNCGYYLGTAVTQMSLWNVQEVTGLRDAFKNKGGFNADISNWNVSRVTNMWSAFEGASNFNADISNWNVRAVTDMDQAFKDATAFNADLRKWRPGFATDESPTRLAYLTQTFQNAVSFKADITHWSCLSQTCGGSMFDGATAWRGRYLRLDGSTSDTAGPPDAWYKPGRSFSSNSDFVVAVNNCLTADPTGACNCSKSYVVDCGEAGRDSIGAWDTRYITNMNSLFLSRQAFNQDISGWNVQGVSEMGSMFQQAVAFNKPLNRWNTRSLTYAPQMFSGATAFNQPLNNWNTSSLLYAWSMFSEATAFNQPLSGWNVAKLYLAQYMFDRAQAFNQNLNSWNTASLEEASGMFSSATSFNGVISGWNVAKVTNMQSMFNSATSFNGDVSGWNVAKVTYMSSMFNSATSFNRNLNSWNTSSLEDASYMFSSATSFNGDVSGWNVAKVTNMQGMFNSATSFNRNLNSWNPASLEDASWMFSSATNFNGDVSGWNVTRVRNMQSMFSGATSFNRNLNSWNTASLEDANYMFSYATNFNGDVSGWNVTRVRYMQSMFSGATSFNQNLNSWNTARLEDTNFMFYNTQSFNGDVSGWNTNSVTNMFMMFANSGFNQPINSWNVSGVRDMGGMFEYASNFNGDVMAWNTASVSSMQSMFRGAVAFNRDLQFWNTASVTTMNAMFDQASVFNQNIGTWNTHNVTDMQSMFRQASAFNFPIGAWNTHNVTDMQSMFDQASAFNHPIGAWNTAQVTNMGSMFNSAWAFNQDIASWDVSLVTAMWNMFSDATAFNQDITNWGTNSSLQSFSMFSGATAWNALYRRTDGSYEQSGPPSMWRKPRPFANSADFRTAVSNCLAANQDGACNCGIGNGETDCGAAFYLSIGQWDTSFVTDMSELFREQAYFSQAVGGWNTTAVTNMRAMFEGAKSFNSGLSAWNTAAVTDMSAMFGNATSFSEDISTWNTANVKTMREMFSYAINFNDVAFNSNGLGSWNTSSCTDMRSMFSRAALFSGAGLTAWNTSAVRDMSQMFYDATSLTSDVSNWNVNLVTNMEAMFFKATQFNSVLSYWNVGLVQSMAFMFAYAPLFDSDLSTWNTSSVTKMSNMFQGAFSFNHPVDGWDTSKVRDFDSMFEDASSYSHGLEGWNTSSATNMRSMFSRAPSFLGPISSWNTAGVTEMSQMFSGASSFNSQLSTWNVVNVRSFKGTFENASTFSSDLTTWNTNSVTDMSKMFKGASVFNGDVGIWNTASVTNMAAMFEEAFVFNKPLGGWDTSAVTDISLMFRGAASFDADVTSWNTGNVQSMVSTFEGASSFNRNLYAWNTAAVASTRAMFLNANSFAGDGLSSWNTAAITDMSSMFSGASNLFSAGGAPLSWDTSAVRDMTNMFAMCSSLNIDLGSWNTAAVTSMAGMFSGAQAFSNGNLNGTVMRWNVEQVLNAERMFEGAAAFNQDISSWNMVSVTSMKRMFAGANSFYSDITGWSTPAAGSNVDEQFAEMPVDARWRLMFKRTDGGDRNNGPPSAFVQDCTNEEGFFASVETFCEVGSACPFPARCPAGNLGCTIGSTGELCRACETGYYKSGSLCLLCPDNSAASAGAAALFVVLAGLIGFKAAEALGAVSTNMIKKIFETLQFFSISFSVEINWPLPVLNFADWLKAFDFNIEFMAPECTGANISWPALFWAGTIYIPVMIAVLFVLRDRYAAYAYNKTVLAIRSENDGEKKMYWIKRPGFLYGTRRTYASESGDRVVKELQRQYKSRATLRVFGVLCMTVLYLPICRLCLQTFDCIEYGNEGKRALLHDVDVDCDDTSHLARMVVAVGVLALVGIGLPIFVILKVRQIRINGKLDDARTLDGWGALYDIYRRVELTEADRLEIAEISRNATMRAMNRSPSLGKSGSMRKGAFQRSASLAKPPALESNSLSPSGSTPAFGRSTTFKIDAETENMANEIAQEQEQEIAIEEAKPQKFTTSKSNIRQLRTSRSTKARERAKKMKWLDRLALYYLAVEMGQKLGVLITGSSNVAEGLSIYGLVFVHWFSSLFVFLCQPWRIITLGFGKYQLANALNKTESIASFLQGAVPLIGFGFSKDSALTGLSTGFIMAIIAALLAVRVFFLLSERMAVKKDKWDFEKEPEETSRRVHRSFIELGKKGKVVGIYALKAQVAVKRRKVRARLEATREAMLTRVQHMKEADNTDEEQVLCLLAIANEMAEIVNMCTVQPKPEGRDVNEQVSSARALLEKYMSAADDVYQKRNGELISAGLYLVLGVHAYDRAMKKLDDDMLEYARAECVHELVSLGVEYVALEDEQRALPIGFGGEELNKLVLMIQADAYTSPLMFAAAKDDYKSVVATLDTMERAIIQHETWRNGCLELFTNPEREPLIGTEVEANKALLEEVCNVLREHDDYINHAVSLRALEWKPFFKTFGRVKCSLVLEEMTEFAVQAIQSGAQSSIEPELRRQVQAFVQWCVESSEAITTCGFSVRASDIAIAAQSSLKVLADKTSKNLEKEAMKRARKRTRKGFFSGMFGGGTHYAPVATPTQADPSMSTNDDIDEADSEIFEPLEDEPVAVAEYAGAEFAEPADVAPAAAPATRIRPLGM